MNSHVSKNISNLAILFTILMLALYQNSFSKISNEKSQATYEIQEVNWADAVDNDSDDFARSRTMELKVYASSGTFVFYRVWIKRSDHSSWSMYVETESYAAVQGLNAHRIVDIGTPKYGELDRGDYDFRVFMYQLSTNILLYSRISGPNLNYIPFETSLQDTPTQTGNISVRVENIPGGLSGIPGNKATVKLYNVSGALMGEAQTNVSAVASFSNIPTGSNYSIKVEYDPGSQTIFGYEYWGGRQDITINSGNNPQINFVRNSHYLDGFVIYDDSTNEVVNTGETLTYGSRIRIDTRVIYPSNGRYATSNARVRHVIDMNKSQSYDFDQTSNLKTISRGSQDIISQYITLNKSGSFFISAAVLTNDEPGYVISDAMPWSQSYELIVSRSSNDSTGYIGHDAGIGWRYTNRDRLGSRHYNRENLISSSAMYEAYSINLPNNSNHSILTGDVTGNGYSEIVTIQNDTLYIIDKSGYYIVRKYVGISGQRSNLTQVSLLEDFSQNGVSDIFVGYVRPDHNAGNWKARVYSGAGEIIKEFTKNVNQDGGMRPIALKDGNVLMYHYAIWSRNPRGLSSWNSETGQQNWEFNFGPYSLVQSIADINKNGLFEISMGSWTPHNGASTNGTNDSNLYTIIIDENGQQIVVSQYPGTTAERKGYMGELFFKRTESSDYSLLSYKNHNHYYPGISKLHIRNLDATIVATFNGAYNGIWNVGFGDLNKDGNTDIVATNSTQSKGMLYVLSNNLDNKYEIEIDPSQVFQLIVDINGDGLGNIVTTGDDGTINIYNYDLSLYQSITITGKSPVRKVIASELSDQDTIDLIVLTDHDVIVYKGGESETIEVPDRKLNLFVHSPGYSFEAIQVRYEYLKSTGSIQSITLPFTLNGGYWGMEQSEIEDICDVSNKNPLDTIILSNGGNRVGAIYMDICSVLNSELYFMGILLVNQSLKIPDVSKWEYYESTDEVMVSMLVAPQLINPYVPLNPAKQPVLLVHGVTGYYPYWGRELIWGIGNDTDYDAWQFYYPYDQYIEDSGILLREAITYLLSQGIFGQEYSYQANTVKVLAHSMGGLVARSYIQSDSFKHDISRLVMLGTPNHGSFGSYKFTHGISGGFIDFFGISRDRHSPAFHQMIPGSNFYTRLNSSNLVVLNNTLSDSYLTVAGAYNNIPHEEIPGQDDGVVSITSANLLSAGVPLLITNHSHSGSGGFTNAENMVVPLLKNNIAQLYTQSIVLGHIGVTGLSDWVDPSIDPLGSMLVVNSGLIYDDFNRTIFLVQANNMVSRIYTASNSCGYWRCLGIDSNQVGLIKRDTNTKTYSDAFFHRGISAASGRYLDIQHIDKVGYLDFGRYTRLDNTLRWISLTGLHEINLEPGIVTYSDYIHLTHAQRMAMRINYASREKSDQIASNGSVNHYIDSKIDTALIYIEIPVQNINVASYEVVLTSPSGFVNSLDNIPENWEAVEDREQGYAYFYIPDVEAGLWMVDYNPELGDVYVNSAITSRLNINTSTNKETFIQEDEIELLVSVVSDEFLANYTIDAIFTCHSKDNLSLGSETIDLHAAELNTYKGLVVPHIESAYCNISVDFRTEINEETFLRQSFRQILSEDAIDTGLENESSINQIPVKIDLSPNYPNPFNPVTNIIYSIPYNMEVRLDVYNVMGQLVRNLVNATQNGGRHVVSFDASGLSSGAYFYRMTTPEGKITRSMMLIK